MATKEKKDVVKKTSKTKDIEKSKKISKFGRAMKAGIGRGNIIELTDDPWNLKL
jgi:hypothetical protein